MAEPPFTASGMLSAMATAPVSSPPRPPSRLDKSAPAIRDMFAGVAPRYDLLNHVLTGALDVAWRRRTAAALTAEDRERVLDLCCGTGDQASALARRGASVVAADFCIPMLALAHRKLRVRSPRPPSVSAADALTLPFPDAAFSAATVSFGIRNVADLDASLAELARVVRPGGRLVILELAVPRARLLRRAYLLYSLRVLPTLGRWLSPRGAAYSYLPASILAFPQRQDFLERMAGAGFADELSWRDLSGGVACLYAGRKARRPVTR